MAERYGFFDSTADDARTYSADDFNQVLSGLLTDGVVGLLPEKTGDLTVRIGAGSALVEGHWYRNTSAVTLTATPPGDGRSRSDWIVLRYDKGAKTIQLVYRESPSELYDNSQYKEIPVANVFVLSTHIVSVTDKRQAIGLRGVE